MSVMCDELVRVRTNSCNSRIMCRSCDCAFTFVISLRLPAPLMFCVIFARLQLYFMIIIWNTKSSHELNRMLPRFSVVQHVLRKKKSKATTATLITRAVFDSTEER